MNTKYLMKSGIIYILGGFLSSSISFFTIPIYTRVMSETSFADYSLYTTWVILLSIFIGLKTDGSLSIAKKKYKDNFNVYTSHALSLSTISFILIFLVSFIFRKQLSTLIGFSEPIFLLIVLNSYFGYLIVFLEGYFIQTKKVMYKFWFTLIATMSVELLSVYLVLKMSNGFNARLYGGIVPKIIIGILALIYILFQGKKLIKLEYLKFTLLISIPLIFHMLGHEILTRVDTIMISKTLSKYELALYVFGYSVGMNLQYLLFTLNTTWVPWYFEAKNKKYDKLNLIVKKYLYISALITVLFLTFYPEFIYVMGGKKYIQSIGIVPIIMVSCFIMYLYTFPVNEQFYNENTKFIPVGTILSGSFNIILNLILLPRIGIYGAAISTFLSYLMLLVLHYIVAKKLYSYNLISMKMNLFLIIITIIYAYIIWFLVDLVLVRLLFGIIIILVILIKYREQIKEYIQKRKNKC